jgi:hypothetical protein
MGSWGRRLRRDILVWREVFFSFSLGFGDLLFRCKAMFEALLMLFIYWSEGKRRGMEELWLAGN